jgi:glyoxylase-like metal-dependent hydrolase (beta-lactamase superfamily II)
MFETKEEEMTQLKIHPLHLGTITRAVAKFCPGLDPAIIADLPVVAWYIEGSDKKILVDTGGTDPSQANPQWFPYRRNDDQSMEKALKKIDLRCEDIDVVIITHFHWDHASGNLLFPRAKFVVQEVELRHTRSLPPDAPGMCPPAMLAIDYSTISGDTEIGKGVKTIFTPGHTHGTQGVLVEGERRIFIAGDTIPLFKNIESDPFVMSSISDNPAMYRESLTRIKELSAFILPNHDPGVFDKTFYT